MTTPTLQYLVAFQNNAYDDPGLITSVASPPGALGGNNVWTDISQFVMTDSGTRGRQHELQQFEAGTRQMQLTNFDGRFTPGNTSSPYSPYVTIRHPFQVRSNWSSTNYGRFTGQVDSWGTSWPDAGQQYTILHVSDSFRAFNLADITSGGYPAQILADGATAYWRFGDPLGSPTAADSGPSGYTARFAGTGVLGQAGALIGNPGTAVTWSSGSAATGWASTSPSSCPLTTAWSFDCWVNGVNWATTADNMIYEAYDATFDYLTLYIDGSGFINIIVNNNSTGQLWVRSNTAVATGAWEYIAITNAAGTVNFYINGVATATTVHSGTNVSLPALGSAYMGYDAVGGAPGPVYNGELQELAIYAGITLTPTQIANHYQLAAFPQEGTGARIGRVLNLIGWSAGARAIDTGKSTVQAQTSSLTSTSALSHMQDVECTEGGALFMTVDGKVRFYARTTLQSAAFTTVNQAQFGDNTAGGDIPFQPAPILAMDDIDLYNEAVATRTGGNIQIWPSSSTSSSITNNGRVTWNPPATLLGISDQEVLGMCQYVVTKYSTPVNRLSAITVDVVSVANTFPSTIPALLSLDLLYQVTVERTVVPGGGATFTQTCDIEHITETINAKAGTWTITFGMEISDPLWWVLGTSQLGTTTRLAW